MSTNTNQDQEIDLGQLFGKIGNLFDTIISSIFKGILFVQKNIILLLVLVAVGVGVGRFLTFVLGGIMIVLLCCV